MQSLTEPACPDGSADLAAFEHWLSSPHCQFVALAIPQEFESHAAWLKKQCPPANESAIALWQLTADTSIRAGFRETTISALVERARTLWIDGKWSERPEDRLILRRDLDGADRPLLRPGLRFAALLV